MSLFQSKKNCSHLTDRVRLTNSHVTTINTHLPVFYSYLCIKYTKATLGIQKPDPKKTIKTMAALPGRPINLRHGKFCK